MNDRLSITLYADRDGFISYECPYCGSSFKLNASDISDASYPLEELFCPYCGLTDTPNRFLSSIAVEAIENLVYNHTAKMLNREFDNMAKEINRKRGVLRMQFKPIEMLPEKKTSDDDTPEGIFSCMACERSVKVHHNTGLSKLFCPFCGVSL